MSYRPGSICEHGASWPRCLKCATKWQEPRLEAAYDALEDALTETHPEHGEYDKIKKAMDAIEDADMALESLNRMWRGM